LIPALFAIEPVLAGFAKTVGKDHAGMRFDIGFEFFPVAFVVSDAFTARTDRQIA
jgi:hypothetical protein